MTNIGISTPIVNSGAEDSSGNGLPFITADSEDAGLDIYAYRVFCRLLRRANGTKATAWESVPNMAKAIGVSQGKVRDGLRVLRARRMIHGTERTGETTIYTVPRGRLGGPLRLVQPLRVVKGYPFVW